jgi:hypothetical protein
MKMKVTWNNGMTNTVECKTYDMKIADIVEFRDANGEISLLAPSSNIFKVEVMDE